MAIMCVLPNKAQPKMNNKNAAIMTLILAWQKVTHDMFKLKKTGKRCDVTLICAC
jgi:hypothetical protein